MNLIKNLSLEASAGSGKTFALSIRYVSLLFLGAEPQTILTLTFTNKAANEMAVRINSLLLELDSPKKKIELNEICRLTGMSQKEIFAKKEQIYQNFLESKLNISTLDSFNTTILRGFSLLKDIMPDFEIGENISEFEFLSEFIMEIEKRGLYDDLIEFSVYEQKRVNEIFNFLKVLNQKRDDIDKISIKIYDINSIKKDSMKIFFDLKELFLSCTTLSASGKNAFEKIETIEDILQTTWITKDSMQDYRYFKKCYTPLCDELFFKLKDNLTLYLKAKEAFYKKKYLNIFRTYIDIKNKLNKKSNTLDFDDITNFVYDLITTKTINNEQIYFRIDNKIEHILIDEFQDTSVTQFKILEPLIEEVVKSKNFKTFFYVGDTKQSIYRFRGGVKELFYYVQKRFDVKKQILDTNYRSSKRVVEFVNRVFIDKIPNYTPQLLPPDKPDSGYIKVVESDELIEIVTQEVFNLLKKGVNPDDIAILTYSNADSYYIKEKLQEQEPTLKVTTATTIKLIDTNSVITIIEFLKYLYFKQEIYLVNFLSLIGRGMDEKIDTSHFSIYLDLHILIKKIVTYFQLYDYDENILKLIEITTNYKDIEDFLFSYQNIDEPSPKKKDIGIKILTIHKSKGLEFTHTIVVDRFKKKPSNRDSMLFYYKGIELEDMYIKFPNREFLDEKYKEAVDANKELQRDDELNTLYVALTRGVNSLIICQKNENSSLKMLDLSPMEEGDIIIEHKKEQEERFDDFEYQPIILGSDDIKIENLSKEEQKERDIGIALHYMLENLDFETKDITSAYWSMKNRFFKILKGEDFEQVKIKVVKILENKEFMKLIKGAKLYKELPLIYKGEKKQLDLLIEKDDRFIVVDYKSSEYFQKKHLYQIKEYQQIISNLYKKRVDAYLIYFHDQIDIKEIY